VFRSPEEWSRVTSLTEYQGKLFASLGSCTSSHLDAPCDFRGRVYAMQVGQNVSYDRDLGAGWKHLTAVKRGGRLELFVNGVRACESSPFEAGSFDLCADRPLRIGLGETDYFSGKIRDVRVYRQALDPSEVGQFVRADHPGYTQFSIGTS
jgi:hypothetical protein